MVKKSSPKASFGASKEILAFGEDLKPFGSGADYPSSAKRFRAA
jgi:hypothetical protein